MRPPSAPGRRQDDQLAAVWSDGLDHHRRGHRDRPGRRLDPGDGDLASTATPPRVSVTSGTAYSLPISDQVTYLTYPVGDTLTVGPTAGLRNQPGHPAPPEPPPPPPRGTPRRRHHRLPPATARLELEQRGHHPEPDRHTGRPATINRIVVDTQSVGSTATGVRDYTVSVDEPGPDGPRWPRWSASTGPTSCSWPSTRWSASAVRITVSEVNFGGYYGGGVPPWWAPSLIGHRLPPRPPGLRRHRHARPRSTGPASPP